MNRLALKSTLLMLIVSHVTLATRCFPCMATLMIVLTIVMTIAEWKSIVRWVPISVLRGSVAATSVTIVFILPLNDTMSTGITDPVRLKRTLNAWIFLNQTRVALWAIQWLSMMIYFAYQTEGAEQ